MKLLLDEMFSADIATALRERGHDVWAVTERPDLRGQSDNAVFRIAQAESRATVTENAGDFRSIAHACVARGERHAGIILTSDGRFPRHESRTLGRLVHALDELLRSDVAVESTEYWLS